MNGSVFDGVDPVADGVLVVVLDDVAASVVVPEEFDVLAVGAAGVLGAGGGVVVVPGLCVVVEVWWFDSGSVYC